MDLCCSICGEKAVTLTLNDTGGSVHIAGLRGYTIAFEGKYEKLRGAIAAQDLRAMHTILWDNHDEGLDFYCPECDKMYCRNHWRLEVAFDPEWPSWYEDTHGTCPQGHRRLMDD